MSDERLLTVVEVGAMLGLAPATVRKMAFRKELPVVRPTGRRAIRFRLSDVQALINGRGK